MALGGSTAMAWVITVGFLVAFVAPVVYLTYLSMHQAEHTAPSGTESERTEPERAES